MNRWAVNIQARKRGFAFYAILVFSLFVLASAPLAQNNSHKTTRQNLRFKHLSREDGLSHTSVHCILQDSKGFMWFATADGLNKFDGYQFTIYRHDAENPRSLSGNFVYTIYEDRGGVIWVGSGGGLSRFDRQTDQFWNYKNDPDDPNTLSANDVMAITEDSEGLLWLGTWDGGLNRFDKATKRFKHYQYDANNPAGISNNVVRSICQDRSGALWLATRTGLNRFDKKSGKFKRYRHDPRNSQSLSDDWVRTVYEDRHGVLWVGTNRGGLNRFNRTTETFERCMQNPKHPTEQEICILFEDQEDNFWVGTANGLYHFDRKTEHFQLYTHDPQDATSLSNNYIYAISADRSGGLWLGTAAGGVNSIELRSRPFRHYQHNPADAGSLSGHSVLSVLEDRSGTLWVGTQGAGLNRLGRDDSGSNSAKFVSENTAFRHYRHDPANPHSLRHNMVQALYKDRRGVLWIGTPDGLAQFDPGAGQFRNVMNPADSEDSDDNLVKSIYEDDDGLIWLGTRRGLTRFDPVTRGFQSYRHDPQDPASLSDDRVYAVCGDKSGGLWVGTSAGLNLFDKRTGRFKRFFRHPADPASLSENAVTSLFVEADGTLWIGTWGGGLNRYEPKTAVFKHYFEKHGLPNNVVHAIARDGQGDLWLSTNRGVARFDPATEIFHSYDSHHGLQNTEFNEGAVYKSLRTGEIYFGGKNGLTRFHPDSVRADAYIPPVVLTDFLIFNEPVSISAEGHSPLRQHISEAEEIVLAHDQNVFTFEFAALHYAAPERNRYAYKMQGFDRQWIQSGDRRFATYTNLDPGEYVFRVRGSNSDAVWNQQGTSIRVIINAPWWRTWWAYTLYVLLIGAVLYTARRYEMNRIRLKNRLALEQVEAKKLKELDQMKSRFFANISHEFRTPLTLVLGQMGSVISSVTESRIKNKLQVAMRNSQRLLQLVNQLLDLSRLEAHSMKLNLVRNNVIPFLKNLVASFEALAQEKGIRLEFKTDSEEILLDYEPDKLEKILTNLLWNALKFTHAGGRICVKVATASTDAGFVEITVQDTGIGISAGKLPHIFDRFYQAEDTDTRHFEGTGIGLALAKELTGLHRGTISVKSEIGKGAEFTMRLPLRQPGLAVPEEPAPVPQPPVPESLAAGEIEAVHDRKTTPVEAAPGDQPLILIVEDHADVRAYIRENLESAYQVQEAGNGKQGYELAQEIIPDLIISDVMMPEMDGYEFSRKIRENEKTSHIPILMLTAKAADEDKIAGLESGVDGYLIKPFNAKELQVRMANLIELRQKLREKFSRATVIRPSEVQATSVDQAFLQRVLATIEERMADELFNVEKLAATVHMSEPQLNRKLNALIGQPPGQLLRSLRLQRAADLLEQNAGNVAEIAYQVGFSDQANFTRSFKKQFGVSPSAYRKGVG
ncbi:MAG: two-component regulator propeller domain-containing protein [bacterium]